MCSLPDITERCMSADQDGQGICFGRGGKEEWATQGTEERDHVHSSGAHVLRARPRVRCSAARTSLLTGSRSAARPMFREAWRATCSHAARLSPHPPGEPTPMEPPSHGNCCTHQRTSPQRQVTRPRRRRHRAQQPQPGEDVTDAQRNLRAAAWASVTGRCSEPSGTSIP